MFLVFDISYVAFPDDDLQLRVTPFADEAGARAFCEGLTGPDGFTWRQEGVQVHRVPEEDDGGEYALYYEPVEPGQTLQPDLALG